MAADPVFVTINHHPQIGDLQLFGDQLRGMVAEELNFSISVEEDKFTQQDIKVAFVKRDKRDIGFLPLEIRVETVAYPAITGARDDICEKLAQRIGASQYTPQHFGGPGKGLVTLILSKMLSETF